MASSQCGLQGENFLSNFVGMSLHTFGFRYLFRLEQGACSLEWSESLESYPSVSSLACLVRVDLLATADGFGDTRGRAGDFSPLWSLYIMDRQYLAVRVHLLSQPGSVSLGDDHVQQLHHRQ